MAKFAPTPEQAAVLDAFLNTDADLVVTAGAGAGKSSTLKLLAEARPDLKFLYLGYNRDLVADARKSFPKNVTCKTSHGLAFATHGKPFAERMENTKRQTAREKARILGIHDAARINDTTMLAPAQLARLVIETITKYCQTADREIGAYCTPRKPGMDDPASMKALTAAMRPYVKKAWADITKVDGKLRFEHDHYLKMYQLSFPDLSDTYDVILFDEAQDANALTASIVGNQTRCRKVVVGDEQQEIYAWRGACNAMAKFQGTRLTLTKSFRFGPAVASVANLMLDVLDADIRIVGHEPVGSVTGAFDAPNRAQHGPDAVLCRTNGGAMKEAMALMKEGYRVALARGAKEMKALAEAAIELQAGRPTWHPELVAFTSWGQVQDYVESETEGKDLKVFVTLVDDYGADVIIDAIDDLSTQERADVVVGTAHGSKGREWNRVRISDDFFAPRATVDNPEPQPDPAEMRLIYVAVTRAKTHLDWETLEWVRKYAALATVAQTKDEAAATAPAPAPRRAAMAVKAPVRRPAPSRAVAEAVLQAAEPVADEPGAPRIPAEIVKGNHGSAPGYVWNRNRKGY